MEVTFQKHFDDRYSQSREHQILDYLNQRGAAVPQVILSHTEQSYLEMTHAGQDLSKWLDQPGLARSHVWEVLAQAATVLVQVSRLEVWHLDIALRNFVVGPADAQGVPQVRLIDFGNAVSVHFPLQKPLWMSPDPSQHSLLRQALHQDWEDFYRRHGLPLPTDWGMNFQVPESVYRDDWTRQLQVEALAARPCVLAHGLGQMMRIARGLVHWPPSSGHDPLAGLLELHDDEQASATVEGLIAQLSAWAQAHRPTPRPMAAAPVPEPIRAGSVAPPLVNPLTLDKHARGRFPSTMPRIEAGEQLPEASQAADALGRQPTAPQPDVVAAEPVAPAPPVSGSSASARKSRAWLPALSGAAIVATGWVLLDMIYSTAQASPAVTSVRLTALGLSGVAFAVLASAICLAGVFFAQARLAWWRRGIYANALGQGVLVMELWVHQMPAQVLWFAAACPLIALFSAFVGAIGSKSPPARGAG
jgi:hypothetical protein